MRGLKPLKSENASILDGVAPLVGAWIETAIVPKSGYFQGVAPLVGAWIETLGKSTKKYLRKSHPSWVRGLKR